MNIDGLPAVTVAGLGLAAVAAGWIDAVVGGGGLIQLPALLLALPSGAAAPVLATNKVASICGTGTSAGTYYRRVRPDLRTALPMAALALLGAALGAACASLLPTSAFRPIVLVALVVVGTYTVARPELGRVTQHRFGPRRQRVVAAAVGVAIGCYDGVLGPGTGSFLVFTLVGLLGLAFLEASATAKIANAATNLGALLVFVPQGAPLWRLGLLMGLGNLCGGYTGARMAVARGNRFIRVVFLLVVAALVVRIGWGLLPGL